MKTKKEILKMTKEELEDYKLSDDLNINCDYCDYCNDCYNCYNCYNCNDCYNCYNCNNCNYCNYCYNCYNCRNAHNLKYAICNVPLTEKEYNKKIKELKK